jgi:hypothetical protein
MEGRLLLLLRGTDRTVFAARGEGRKDSRKGSEAVKWETLPILCPILLALVLLSVTPFSKANPAVETAYTQDGCTCVRGHVRDQDNRPVMAARVSLLEEKTLMPVGFVETDKKGDFLFRPVPLNEELMLAVEAEGFTKASVPGITVRPSYSFVTTVRLSREAPARILKGTEFYVATGIFGGAEAGPRRPLWEALKELGVSDLPDEKWVNR